MSQTNARVAIVTGAARGIGAAAARRLAADGFAVGLIDLEAASCAEVVAGIRADGGTALGFSIDVSDETAVIDGVAQIAREMGSPTVLINNAGIIRDSAFFRMTTAEWEAVMGVHLRGAFLMSRTAQAYMTEAGWGRIVNMSSISALGNKGQANYAAAKAGLQGFTKTLAIELGRFGITVNCIAPGYIETDMLRQTAERIGIGFEEYAERLIDDVPVGRLGRPDDIAAAVSFFARDDASFVTGQVLYVGGGPFA